MRTARKIATSALAGTLLATAFGVAGAGAAEEGSTVTQLSVEGVVGTLAITVPTGTFATPVNLGAVKVATGAQAAPNALGTVTVSDSSTGLLRVATTTASSGLTDPLIGFCIDTDNAINTAGAEGITCSADANKQILSAAVTYKPGAVTKGGDGTGEITAADAALGVAKVVYTQLTPGAYTYSWSPSFSVTPLATQTAGTYYGQIKHSVSAI